MVDEGLRLQANLAVPANFDHRVRAALQAGAPATRSRPLSAFTFASIAAAAAVLLAILFTQSWRRGGKETAVNSAVEPKALVSPVAPALRGRANLEPSSPQTMYSRGGSASKRSHAVEAVAVRNTEPEVLVPKGQEELLREYMEQIAARKARVRFSADLQHEPNMKPVEVPSIEISELVVKPLSDLSSN
jgi:hypothetical protein